MAETLNLTPLCRCCHKKGVFKSLFSDFIYENEIENYSQMLSDTFGILFVPSEHDKIYTICDECIEKLRISTEFKNCVLACEKKIIWMPLIENDVPIKIEKCWSFASSEKEGPLLAVDIKAEREETANDEHGDTGINKGLDEESNEDVTIEESRKESDENFSESEGPLIAVDTKVTREETAKYEDNALGINKVLDEESNQDGRIKKSGNETDETFSESEGSLKNTSGRHENKCNICNKTFRFEKYLHFHMRSHDRYKCQICPEILSNKREHTRHVESKHVVDGKYCCVACDATFLEVKKLKYHIESHSTHRCDVCKKDYKSKNALRSHEMVHKDERMFKCSICNKLFTQRGNMKIHMETHTAGTPHECRECGRKFKVMRGLLRHRQNMHMDVKKYSCRYCDKGFMRKDKLVTHEMIHTGVKPYECEKCNKAFIRKDSLESHQKVHEIYKPYSCSVCDNKFKTKKFLNRHMLTHTEISECNICKKTFKEKQTLREHMSYVHLGFKPTPVECDICKKTFKTKSNIRKHMLFVHLGFKRTYIGAECDICKKTFKSKQIIRRHMMVVHLG